MRELEVTWGRAVQVWWAYLWRSFLYAILPCVVVGGVIGAVMALNKVPVEQHLWELRLVGFLIATPMAIWVTKVLLSKTFSGFRIALIEVNSVNAQQSAQADRTSPSV